MKEIRVVIEIPMGSGPIKYTRDKTSGYLFVDSFITSSYPCNVGYIPNTVTRDGDLLDALIITPQAVKRPCEIRCRAIGLLELNENGQDKSKILAVPVSCVTDHYNHIHSFEDLPSMLLDKITHFFLSDHGKVGGWLGKEAAEEYINATIKSRQRMLA